MTDPGLLSPGDRVRVVPDPDSGLSPWPGQPTATVIASPTGEAFEETSTRRGLRRTYWVRFDEPQLDLDGDGPYTSSQVLDLHLQRLSI
jgi:hypothetical protein